MDKLSDLEGNDLSAIFAINHIFKIVDYKEFGSYLIKNKIKMTEDIFEGYLFFLKTISRGMLENISRSSTLNIESNMTFGRAINRGVSLEKITNNCQKVIFIKNLYKLFQLVWKSTNVKTLETNFESIRSLVIKGIDEISTKHVKLTSKYATFGLDKVIRRLSINYTLIFLNDTRRGRNPLGYFFSLSPKNSLEKQYALKVFNGYKTTLCFLWEKLLNEENVQAQCNKLIKEITYTKNWYELDGTFETSRRIVAEIEKEFDLTFGFEKYFNITKPINVDIWEKSLFDKVPEPMLSIEEKLQQEILWYPVQAMTGMIFNGVAAFSRLLIGDVRLKRAFDNPDKTIIARFVHPVECPTGENQHDYSYAILVDAFGSIADYSGWLIFYDCCGDYSGFSGSEHQFAESIIKKLLPNIQVIDLTISKKDLLNYLQLYSSNVTDDFDTTSIKIPVNGEIKKQKKILKSVSATAIIAHQHTVIQAFKGFLLELLAYYYLAENSIIRWRYKNQKLLGDDEIDVIARDKNKNLFLISCMSSYEGIKIQKLDEQSRLMIAKKNLFIKEFGEYNTITKIAFLPEDPTTAQIEESKKYNTDVFSLKRLLNEDSRFSSVKKTDIIRLFALNKDNASDDFTDIPWRRTSKRKTQL
ncbi:MAG: hypothetical protein ACFCUE_15695 [Candidatus Bathyarchaeia archaeon]|jgi:hypothetical protein